MLPQAAGRGGSGISRVARIQDNNIITARGERNLTFSGDSAPLSMRGENGARILSRKSHVGSPGISGGEGTGARNVSGNTNPVECRGKIGGPSFSPSRKKQGKRGAAGEFGAEGRERHTKTNLPFLPRVSTGFIPPDRKTRMRRRGFPVSPPGEGFKKIEVGPAGDRDHPRRKPAA